MSVGYVPNYGDLDNLRYERLLRTRSRAYQMACWQGYLGTHEFFLGRTWRGWATLLFTMVAACSFIVEWLLGLALIVCVVGLNMVAVRAIAASDPDAPPYGEPCGAMFQSVHMLAANSIAWDLNFWKGKEPTDPAPPDMPTE